MHWWHRDVVEPGKLPLLLCLGSFVVVFVATRTITRSIRAGRGPWRDHVTADGTHVHHAVPGLLVLVAGAFVAVGAPSASLSRDVGAIAVGTGTALVLDEFALILRLQDVYWTAQGRLSVELVCLTTACVGLTLVGIAPFGVDDMGSGELAARVGALAAVSVTMVLAVVCVLKGKLALALLGTFVPVLAWVGACRLGRPSSMWARRYGPAKLERARRRTASIEGRWVPRFDRFIDVIAGRPSSGDVGRAIDTPRGEQRAHAGRRPER